MGTKGRHDKQILLLYNLETTESVYRFGLEDGPIVLHFKPTETSEEVVARIELNID